jgi:hypothetical protein
VTLPEDKGKKLSLYLKYSGMALQFFVLIAVAAWLGQKLDAWLDTSKPFLTVLLILVFAGGYFYKMYLDLMK